MAKLLEFGCHLRMPNFEVSSLIESGVLLEKYGFDLVRLGDHTLTMNRKAPYPHAHTVLAMIGALTKKIRLSTGVSDPYRRHPVELAQAIATLDHLTHGRAALGIGAGEMMNLEPFGIDWERPVTHLKEAVEIIKSLWEADPSNPINYNGKVFNLRNGYLQIKPHQKPRPKIYVGAAGPLTRRLAARIADGWIPVPCEAPSTLKAHLQDLHGAAAEAGRDPGDLEVVATIYTDIDEDYEKAYTSVKSVARNLLVMERSSLKLMGHTVEIPANLSVQEIQVNDLNAMDRLSRIAQSIPRHIVESIVAIGSPDQCISQIEKFLNAGATNIVICNLGPRPAENYRIYSEKIMPYLREKYSAR